MRRIQDFKINFGVFKDVIKLLPAKVASMHPTDRYCILSYDEMQIKKQIDFDKNEQVFYGTATLGESSKHEDNPENLGDKMFVIVARGVKTNWKQIIASHVTLKDSLDPEILRDFILDTISSVESCGMYVLALVSDSDGRNKSLWTSLGIHASRLGKRCNSFFFDNHEIFAFPDSCHLLKNLKAAMLRQLIFLPKTFVEQEKLPTNMVKGSYIKELWDFEIERNVEQRSLYHIREEDINPSNFDKMNVGAPFASFPVKLIVL